MIKKPVSGGENNEGGTESSGGPDPEKSWLAEIERRMEDLESGQVKSIPWEMVKSRLSRRIKE